MAVADASKDQLARNINAMYVAPVYLWMQDWTAAESQVDWQIPHAEEHGWAPYRAVGIGLRGEIQIRRGLLEAGILNLSECLEELRVERQFIWLGTFGSALAEAYLAAGFAEKACCVITEVLQQADNDGETWFTPEIYRVAARVGLARPGVLDAETLLRRAIATAQRQSALAWELRAAIDLASLWRVSDREQEALELLEPVYLRYDQADVTPDVLTVGSLLQGLGWEPPSGDDDRRISTSHKS
jgi:tetratricopeptide (TPR) repeat protein